MRQDEHATEVLLAAIERAASSGDARRAFEMVTSRLTQEAAREDAFADYVAPLHEGETQPGLNERLERYARAALAVAEECGRQGADISTTLAGFDDIPEPLRGRLLAAHLYTHVAEQVGAAQELVLSMIRERRAFPEGLALLRELDALQDPAVERALAEIVGTPPPPDEIAGRPLDSTFPSEWMHIHSWLVAMPSAIQTAWRDADAVLTARVGAAPDDGRLMGDVQTFSGPTTPFAAGDLSVLEPAVAADQIAQWTPPPDQVFGPSPRGLERELQVVVRDAPHAWASDPVALVTRLRHPTYIAAYFHALRDTVTEVLDRAQSLAQAVLVVAAEPWPVQQLSADSFEADQDWSAARADGIQLLGALWGERADLGESDGRARDAVFAVAGESDDTSAVSGENIDPLTSAINRPSTKALNVAFSWAGASHDRGSEDWAPPFLELLEGWLIRPDWDGLEGRAIIASRLPFLRHVAPEWYERAHELLVGDAAPGDLGPRTFDLFVRWGRPYRDFLGAEVSAYRSALETEPTRALQHVLHGYLWGVEPWDDPTYLINVLRGRNVARVSEAGEVLARLVRSSDDSNLIQRAADFWRAALDEGLPNGAYAGFGWFADVACDAETWLDLMARTVGQSAGAVDWEQRVAERAGEFPSDPRALGILVGLLTGDIRLWHAHTIAQISMRALEQTQGESAGGELEDVRRRLRETLLQRGFFEAHDVA